MNWDVIQIGMELNVEEGYFGEDIKLNFSTCCSRSQFWGGYCEQLR